MDRRVSWLVWGFIGAISVAAVIRYVSPWERTEVPVTPELEAAVQQAFRAECTVQRDAEREISRSLESGGFSGWSVVSLPAALGDSCTTALIDGANKRVIVIEAVTNEIRAALAAYEEALLDRCLELDEAADLLRESLADVWSTPYRIRTDGALVGPVDDMERVANHAKAGCYVFSGTGWDHDGKRIFYLSGP